MAGGLSVTISAVDKTTATIDAINARVAKFTGGFSKGIANATAATSRMQASLTKFGEVSGINRVAASIRGMGRASSYAFGKMSELLPVLGVLGSAASLAGIQRMTASWADWGLKISNASRQMGVGAKQLTGWQGAAALAGGSADAMSNGLQTLGQNMYDAIGGRNTEAIVMFRTLGLSFQDAAGHARKAADVMPEIADKIASIRDPFARAQVGVTLFGGAWQGLEPLLVLGSKRMLELEKVSEQYGYTSDESVEKAKDLALAQREVGAAAEGLRNRIAERLAPILTPMLERFARWIATSPLVTRGVEMLGRAAVWLGDKLEHIDWDMLGKRAEEWGERLKSVLALLQRFGIVPDLSGVFGGSGDGKAPVAPQLPAGSPLATPSVPAAPQGSDNRHWWERFYKPGPGLLDGILGPPAANSQAPNGAPRLGPTFGPQNPQADPSPADRAYKPLMDFVAKTEGTDRGRGYNETLGYGKWTGGNVDLTHMTLDQIDALQQSMLDKQGANPNRSSAVGRYQITQTTLRDLRANYGFRGDQMYDEKMQDHLFKLRLDQQGGASQDNLAAVWASIPDSATGRSHYGQRTGATSAEVQQALKLAQAPVAQGTPLTLGSAANSDTDKGKNSEVHLRVSSDAGLRTSVVSNPASVPIQGPYVQTPGLLGAMP